jgi:hypothetical protein
MTRFIKRLTMAAFAVGLGWSAHTSAAEVVVDEKSFGCIEEMGTKVKKTYIRHSDPAKLKEAVRIFETGAAEEYPVGTILQLVPIEAMVKHEKSKFPNSNGWEFLLFDVKAEGAKIVQRGDSAANPLGNCLTCHTGAAKFDFVCDKGHGCAPIPVKDEQILAMQAADARCKK